MNTYCVTPKTSVIPLGKQGENQARQIVFDISGWVSEYGAGTAELLLQRSGDTSPWPVVIDQTEEAVTWVVDSTATANAGRGQCELLYLVDEVVVKSYTWDIRVIASLENPDSAPSPTTGWVAALLEQVQGIVDGTYDASSALPDYVQDNIDAVEANLSTFATANVCNLAFITDIHANCNDASVQYTQEAMARSVAALNQIAEDYNISLLVLGGDYLGNRTTSEKELCLTVYGELADIFRDCALPVMSLKGNHDDNSIVGTADQYITDEERYQLLDRHWVGKNDVTMCYGNVEKTVGYADFANYKIRVLFVDSADPATYTEDGTVYNGAQNLTGISDAQLEFLKNALYLPESGWGVVIFSHHNLFATDYYDYPTGIQGQNGEAFRAIVAAFQNGAADTTYDVDYSGNGSNEVICAVHGHLHSDRAYLQDSGLLVISCNPACPENTNSDDAGNETSKTYPGALETAWDIISIDRANKMVYTTRYGLGDNRSLAYGTADSGGDDDTGDAGDTGDTGDKTYTEVAYLVSPGNCYIDTEVTSIYHFAIKLRKETALSTTLYHIGSIEDDGSGGYRRTHITLKEFQSDSTWNVNIGVNGGSYESFTGLNYASVDDVRDIEGSVNLTTASFYVNYTSSWTVTNNPCTGTTFWLFGRNSGASSVSASQDFVGRIYYFKAYDADDNLVADMIPVLDSNGTPCMYCKVREQFFYNGGSGTMSYGEEG
ncbi:MAG: metallophosphoesterase [Oscillospiraceae bacterium]|nr:metallophosphoesterase [Oscillospiraceae bacterium]